MEILVEATHLSESVKSININLIYVFYSVA